MHLTPPLSHTVYTKTVYIRKIFQKNVEDANQLEVLGPSGSDSDFWMLSQWSLIENDHLVMVTMTIQQLHIFLKLDCKQPLVEVSLPPAGIAGAASRQLVPAGSCSPPSPAKPSCPAAPPCQLPRHALSSLSCPLTRRQIGFDFFSTPLRLVSSDKKGSAYWHPRGGVN